MRFSLFLLYQSSNLDIYSRHERISWYSVVGVSQKLGWHMAFFGGYTSSILPIVREDCYCMA